jgi:copper resistance protein D
MVERPGSRSAQSRPTERRTVTYGALSIARGQILYADNCVACHGTEGYGDGPAAASLAKRPSNLTEDHLFHHGDDMLFDWVSNGIPDSPMPPFGGLLSEVERWDLINFLRAQAEADQTNAMTAEVKPWRPLTAPDFVFQIPPGAPETLKEQRGRSVVLLVLYGAGSTDRLAKFEAAYAALAKAEVRVIAIPMATELQKPATGNGPRSPIAALANEQAVAAYTLFRRVPSVEGILPMPEHMEVLIDRQGYLRARWIPGEGDGWGDLQSLLDQVGELSREPRRPPASDEHVSLK